MRDPSADVQIRTQLEVRRDRLKQTIGDAASGEELIPLLKEVEAALERINAGSYGICEICSEPIEEEYLRSDPLVKICLSHLSDEQKRAVERDLELAHRIQAQLLPPADLVLKGWEIHYRYEPAGPVSGDYCDVIQSPGDRSLFLCGDVSGKGVAASLLMSNLHAIFRSLDTASLPLEQLMGRANRVFAESTLSSQFATLICGRAGAGGDIELCNAGHCPVLLSRKQHVDLLPSNGLPLGLFLHSEFQTTVHHLEQGDILLCYTDGLTESRGTAEEEFGESRLAAALARHRDLPLRSLVAALLDEAKAFRNGSPVHDDLTVMALKRTL